MHFTDERNDTCVNDEHSEKAFFLIVFTDDGIEICTNDEHL